MNIVSWFKRNTHRNFIKNLFKTTRAISNKQIFQAVLILEEYLGDYILLWGKDDFIVFYKDKVNYFKKIGEFENA